VKKSKVKGQKSKVKGQKSEVKGQRSRVKGQKLEVKGQKSKVKGQESATCCSLLTTHYSLSVFCCLWLAAALPAERLPDSLRSFGKAEREQVQKALDLQAITEPELGFDKKWATDSFFRLKVVDDLLDNPLHGPGYCDSSAWAVSELGTNLPALLLFEDQQTDVPMTPSDTVMLNREIDAAGARTPLGAGGPGLSENLVRSLQLMLGSYEVADRYLKQSLARLEPVELDRLLASAPVLWGDEDDSTEHYLKGALHREFNRAVDTAMKYDTDTVLPILRRIDRRALALSGLAVCLAANRARVTLADAQTESPVALAPAEGVRGDVIFSAETKWGRVVVGGSGDNDYIGDFALVIDPGGNDRYAGRVGAGIGVLSHPFGVCLDLAGNDVYDSPGKLFNFGAGLFGVGVLIDCSGNDVYRGYHNVEGIGMYGTGVLLDVSGDDIYEGGWNCQGSGFVGSGLLVDAGGNDVYRVQNYGQGFASVWGYGLLADHAGNDVYYAGGKYIHRPLLPNDYRSFAQGFAIGFRPDCSGGVGFLFDKSGNDFYNAEVFAQATSYWYSLGMIYDGSGNDHYNANQYSQGAGIHLSVGILIDREGDDQYFSRLGPTQGEGHDLSVGILIDGKGNDSYACSGGQGIGLTNSFAMLIDEQGHDNYMTTEAIGQGTGTWARGFGGMGVFVDEDGDNDRYVKGSPGEDNAIWTQGTYGTGISLKARPKPAVPAEDTTFVPDTSGVKRAPKDVFKDASVWQVGEAWKKVRKARKELISLGRAAAEYMAREQFNTKDGLKLEAMAEFARNLPDTIAPFLFGGLRASNRYTRSNCAYLIGQAKVKSGVDSLLAALKLPGFRPRWALGAFGEIGDRRVVPRILEYLNNPAELTRITTCATLGKLKDPAALPGLVRTLADPMFTVRSAAEQAIVDIGDTSVGYLLALPRRHDWSLRQSLHTARLLGTLGAKLDTVERRAGRIGVREWFGSEFLGHPSPAVRGVAVEALGKMAKSADAAERETIIRVLEDAMSREADRFVLGKYGDALPGRQE